MTLLQTSTLAGTRAAENLQRNLSALAATQPELQPWVTEACLPVEWVFARDGCLTALAADGHWWARCSLPQRAAQAMFRTLQISGAVGCLLTPSHAAQITIALQMLRPEQAVVAVAPEMQDLAAILHCDDFAAQIEAHRLWFAAGPAWDVSLRRLLEERTGLATPSQFIRPPDADPQKTESMIVTAQQIFAEINAARSACLEAVARQPVRSAPRHRLCVIASCRFRLWNDIGQTMLDVTRGQEGLEVVPFDADDPLCSAPTAILKAAADCGAMLTANTARTDLPGLLPEQKAWITWVTGVRIPSSTLAGENDHLILADPRLRDAAIKSGWNQRRIHIGCWPQREPPTSVKTSGALALIVDTLELETPKDLVEYSSHGLLWEAIRHELQRNPFALNDPNAFLKDRLSRFGIGQDTFPYARFIEKLILPAYQQGLARLLIAAKVPLRLWGQGWESLPEFQQHAAGAIRSREQLHHALAQSSALVDAWPNRAAHPIESAGVPIVRSVRHGPNPAPAFVSEARNAISGRLSPAIPTHPPFSAQLIGSILRR